MWGGNDVEHRRNITWQIENPKQFVDRNSGKLIKAVIEHVRDGSTVRALLLPEYQHITLMISGIRVSYFLENLKNFQIEDLLILKNI